MAKLRVWNVKEKVRSLMPVVEDASEDERAPDTDYRRVRTVRKDWRVHRYRKKTSRQYHQTVGFTGFKRV